jgi:hypothetical protein
MTTAIDVAKWMVERLEDRRFLYQEDTVYAIKHEFGDDFVYINGNGNLAIVKPVLDAFNKLTPDVVWLRGERCWRKREQYDKPGRQQS